MSSADDTFLLTLIRRLTPTVEPNLPSDSNSQAYNVPSRRHLPADINQPFDSNSQAYNVPSR